MSSTGTSSSNPKVDDALYLKEELFARVKAEPILLEWMTTAITDGMWYWDLTKPENEW